MKIQQDPISIVRWIVVRNADTIPAPAYAVMEIIGSDDDGAIVVQQPSDDSIPASGLLINSSVNIDAGDKGHAHATFPAAVLYETADGTPRFGTTWGSGAGSWKLRKWEEGFGIIGTPGDNKVNVIRIFC